MEVIHLLEYSNVWEVMYSYYTREYCWSKRFCLCIGSNFQSEEIHNDVHELSEWDILSIVRKYTT